MAEKKKTAKTKKSEPQKIAPVLSDKDRVKKIYETALVVEASGGFVVLGEKPKNKNDFSGQIGAGISKNEDDAWKRAAHAVS